jgi:pyruvate dehydrogenase E2 component (dihydrolipoamide acetyltransferase)
MVRSLATAAHVTNVFEADMTKIAALRERAKSEFKRKEGFSLTFLPFVASAVIQALRAFPEFNAHLDAEAKTATLYRGVNLGIAVGRDEGLIVPVVKGADGMNLVGLARGINDVATRARTKGGLKPDDVSGGTFTITNGGSFGTLIETPIINQPQAAILGTGAVVKRPVVMTLDGSDAVAIRHMMYLYLSYDHRWIDGHKAAQFNLRLKQILEEADFAHELAIEPA